MPFKPSTFKQPQYDRKLPPKPQSKAKAVAPALANAWAETDAKTSAEAKVPAIVKATNPSMLVVAYNKPIADELKHRLTQPLPPYPPSEEQSAFLSALSDSGDNLILRARAGTGKTSTLCMAVQHLNGNADASTIHSLGLRIWRQACKGRVEVAEDKTYQLMDSYLDANRGRDELVRKLGRGWMKGVVSIAKLNGVGVFSHRPMAVDTLYDLIDEYGLETAADVTGQQFDWGVDFALQLYKKGLDYDNEIIDYDDMLLAPLIHNVPFNLWPQYDYVMVDEMQDLSAVRTELVLRVLGDGRFVGVGDERQAIYAFSGSMSDAMAYVQAKTSAQYHPLTVTYRCPRKVVALANQWVPDLRAHQSNGEGEVSSVGYDNWDVKKLLPGDAVLCRNNKPLLQLTFKMLKHGMGVHIEGRDIASDVNGVMGKWPQLANCSALIDKVTEHFAKKAADLVKKKKPDKAEMQLEKGEVINTLLRGCIDRGQVRVDDAKQFVRTLFTDTKPGYKHATPILCSAHKSKGKEWENVYLLGRDEYMPSPYALRSGIPEFVKQEENLQYVAVTRTMKRLVEVNVKGSSVSSDKDKGMGGIPVELTCPWEEDNDAYRRDD